MHTIRINCFGQFSLFANGDFICIKNKKAEELLAFLISERGGPVRKVTAAEALWPKASPENAADSLYKVCSHLRKSAFREIIPVKIQRDSLQLEISRVESDLFEFERLYMNKNNIEYYAKAVELYTAPLFFCNYYEWSARAEAYYDFRYCEMLDVLTAHYTKNGNTSAALYYQGLLRGYDK